MRFIKKAADVLAWTFVAFWILAWSVAAAQPPPVDSIAVGTGAGAGDIIYYVSMTAGGALATYLLVALAKKWPTLGQKIDGVATVYVSLALSYLIALFCKWFVAGVFYADPGLQGLTLQAFIAWAGAVAIKEFKKRTAQTAVATSPPVLKAAGSSG